MENRLGRSKKFSQSVQAFNKNDSVAFQENRAIEGIAYDLFQQSLAPEIERIAESRRANPVRILEVGCGSGPWIEAILSHIRTLPHAPPVAIKGIDPAERLVNCARQRLRPYRNVEVETNAFQDFSSLQKYDLVYFVDVVQHFETDDYEKIFARSSELLVPGGSIVVIDKEKYSFYALKMMIKRKVRELPDYYQTAEYPSFRLLTSLGYKHGFQLNRRFRKDQFRCLIMAKRA